MNSQSNSENVAPMAEASTFGPLEVIERDLGGVEAFLVPAGGDISDDIGSLIIDRDDHTPEQMRAWARLFAAAPELLQGMKDLYRAYVNLLEAGRDRIATYGGQCDSVETMERGDPWLKKARDVVAKAEGQSCA